MTATLDALLQHDSARDLRLNLRVIRAPQHLTPQQAWGAALASAIAVRSEPLAAAVAEEAGAHLSAEVAQAVRTGAALMTMNNVYYRFVHLMESSEYSQLPAGLRMQGLASTAAPKLDLELWAIATSVVNGCGMCIQAHEKQLRQLGASPAMVQEIVRIAAVVVAAAVEQNRMMPA
ncbi:MAG: carboxymuconolactone decarboxylase family protein [Planctomycetota bacterium]